MKSEIGIRVQECLDNPKNHKAVDEIVLKMGRVLAKKLALEKEQPVMVFDGRVWIGNYSFASNRQFLDNNHIKAIGSCLELALPLYLPNITYRRFQLKDTPDERFQNTALQFINWVQACQGNVYVHCFSGYSRSVALLLAFIMYKEGKSYDEALGQLRQSYPKANPNTYFQSILRNMIIKPPETNLLDADFQSAPKSPLRSPLKMESPSKSNQEINLLQIEVQAVSKVQQTSQSLLGEFVPSLLTEGNSITNESKSTANELEIFESKPEPTKQSQSLNPVQLLGFNQQSMLLNGDNATSSSKQQEVEQQNLLVFQVLYQKIQPPVTESEHTTTITQLTQQTKVQTINLLDHVTKIQPKPENEETFADNTDFTQKKVKKHKKKK